MTRVLRYEVPVDDQWHEIELSDVIPEHVAARRADTVEFWALNDGGPTRTRSFRVYGTGHHAEGLYRGTALTASGMLVWHLFEKASS